MPKRRSTRAILDPPPVYAGGVHGEAKCQFKYQTLTQNYHELRMETFAIKNRLEEAKQRKRILAAEVRFLRSRYDVLVRSKNKISPQEQNFIRPAKSNGRSKMMTQQNGSRKESNLQRLPPIPPQPKKKQKVIEEVTMNDACSSQYQHLNPTLSVGKEALFDSRKANCKKESIVQNSSSVVELNVKEAALRKSVIPFDLNQNSPGFSGREGSLSCRVAVFDLNEISVSN